MSHGSLRLRLSFDSDLTSNALHSLTRQIMYQPPFLPPDIGGLASLIQHDFGINEPQGLALSIDLWRLPLCSSTAVLQNNDNLKVARGTGPEASLQISGGLPWASALPTVPGKQAAEREQPLSIEAAARAAPAQLIAKKRKREQTPAGIAPAQKSSVPPITQPPVPESDSSEESESESEESSEEDEPPAKSPSRNARRKKHKRQLKRLGLLEGKQGRPGSTPSGHTEQQAGQPQAAVNEEADRTGNNNRRRAEEPPARSHRSPLEAEDNHESRHTKLPKRGEQWQQSADVAEFVQKGHVHFTDSDSDNDVSRAQEARAVLQQAAQKPSAATNGIVSSQTLQQRPEQAPPRERTQPAPRVQRTPRVNYDALPKPQLYPLEGDVIAYRLLHIGADWTPQVSEWREGRILSLDTAQQSVVVEPWGQNRALQRYGQAQDGDAFEDDDEEEQPPTEYGEDGVLTTSLHSFADLRIIKDMASSVPGAGAKERWRQQVENIPEEADEPGAYRVGDLGQLPPPPLVNGLQPGPGHTASARPAQPVSTPVSKPVSRHTEEHKQQALARPERTQHHAEGSQRAQKSAGSTQPAPAQQAPAEPSAAQPALPERQPLGTWPEVSPVTGNGKGTSAARSMPAAEAVNPIHSPLGPPVSGGAASRSPAGFAQVAAALKARRAELAARQKALSPLQQAPLHAGNKSAQAAADSQPAPAQTPSQSQTPVDPVETTPILEQVTNELAQLSGSQAAGQLEASAADAVASSTHDVSISALASLPQPAAHVVQQHENGIVSQAAGVRTRSAARQEEHSAIPTASKSSPGMQPSHQPGSVTERSHEEGTPEGSSQVHTKRPRASTRGSLIGPLLARLRKEEEAAANANGTAADV